MNGDIIDVCTLGSSISAAVMNDNKLKKSYDALIGCQDLCDVLRHSTASIPFKIEV
jgi:hypothetical protein